MKLEARNKNGVFRRCYVQTLLAALPDIILPVNSNEWEPSHHQKNSTVFLCYLGTHVEEEEEERK